MDQLLLSRGSENIGPIPTALTLSSAAVPCSGPPVLGDVTNTTGHHRPPLQRMCSAKVEPVCAKPVVVFAEPVRERVPASLALPSPAPKDLDVDKAVAEDPQQVAEYAADIYWHLQQQEGEQLPQPGYMDRQPQVTARMRAILVDWLVDVHKKYKLQAQTLFLAVGILDRFLEKRNTLRRHLQLVGITALLLASKFEELYPPQINDFVYVTDKAYSKEEVMRMEVSILSVLDFRLCTPTSVQFLERYQAVNGCGEAHKELAQYLLELTLVDYRMVKYTPSHLAAAAVLLSNKLLRRQPPWTPAVVKHTKLTEQMLRECGKEICTLLENAETNPLQAVRKKFSQVKHHSVAKMGFASLVPATPPPPPPPLPAPAASVRSPSAEDVQAQAAHWLQATVRPAVLGHRGSQGSRLLLGQPTSPTLALGVWSPVETVTV
eukprot:CAMPEP_0171083814 /NCGR_PEP_ID=MMETSP0766_2-20121228/17944_1 /TAXON_ID=439317 /ORGANISM="Gambierdiscus australes, Strain CAWD 149" /LENGTH=433 /DNA_ID=CAMNT_0011541271 /DNA_START=138 /DNA_END=1439 /DNA_ORIENTATION=-